MTFSYDGYRSLLALIREHHYPIISYRNWDDFDRCVILRHDIDTDIKKALKMARLEVEEGVVSTYFVLLTSDFYNVFSKQNAEMLQEILSLGHDIGLHFDEVRYPECTSIEAVKKKIQYEVGTLEKAIGSKIHAVSMHRPSKLIMDADLKIEGLINFYGKVFFKEFKYLSDSRRRWREPVEDIIKSEKFDRLQILTHAFWYDEQEYNLHDSVSGFINSGNRDRYHFMQSNFTDLESVMAEKECEEIRE